MKRALLIFCASIGFILLAGSAFAAMSSTNYLINWDSVNSGGDEQSSSVNYRVYDTVGEQAPGVTSSTNYRVQGGYRAFATSSGALLSLRVYAQNASTKTAYSSVNFSANTVTVPSPGSLGGVGTLIAVVENEGYTQKVAFGKIVSVIGSTVTVDGFDGATTTMSAVVAGGNDFVYATTNSSIGFGDISPSTGERVATILTSVESNNTGGYTVYYQANQALRNATGHAIPNVTTAVVASTEQYGISATGTRALLSSSDQAVSVASLTAVQSRASVTGATDDRIAMIYKVATTADTPAGNYSQSLVYTLTANF